MSKSNQTITQDREELIGNFEKRLSHEERIRSLEDRLVDVEGQLLVCMRFMRHEAEKQAKEKDPDFKVHDLAKA